jgi:hypothetical protein
MRTLNKNIIAALVVVATAIITDGCTKRSELDPQSLSNFTPDNTLNSPAAFLSAVQSMNANARIEYFGDSAPMLTESIFTDSGVEGTTDKTTPAQDLNVRITPTANLDSDDFNKIGRYWYIGWAGIHYANTIISRIDNATWPADKTVRGGVLGAAYFHRAYNYYRLTHQFGDVPLLLKEETAINTSYVTTQRIVILKQMKADLEVAVTLLSDAGVNKGDVTKGAAYHLLAKIDLALGLFDDAITACNAVINGGVYKLMTARFGINASDATKNVIWDLHRPENKSAGNNTEALYNVIDRVGLQDAFDHGSQIMRNIVPMWHNGSILTPGAHVNGIVDAVTAEFPLTLLYGRGIGRARPTSYATQQIWTDSGPDLRHAPGNWVNMTDLVYNDATLKTKDAAWYGKKLVQWTDADAKIPGKVFKNGPQDSIRAWYSWPHYKVFVNPGGGNTAVDTWWSPPRGTNTDWYVFRLAETYLLRAEAYIWKGQTAQAMADINAVRGRAQATLYTDASKINIGTILDERQRELYWEEPRKTELARIAFIFAQTGIPSYTGKTYNVASFSTNNFFYDRIMEKNNFYSNSAVITNSGNHYTISPYHVLWPIPQNEINLNTGGHLNQNKGYPGSESNVPPLDHVVQ